MGNSRERLDELWQTIDRMTTLLPNEDEERASPGAADVDAGSSRGHVEDGYLDSEEEEEEDQVSENFLYSRILHGIFRRLQRYSEERNIFKVKTVLEEMVAHLPYASMINHITLQDNAESVLDRIQDVEPVLIFSAYGEDEEEEADHGARQVQIAIPRLIIDIRRDLASRIAREPEMLRRISPREFEELMAEVFSTFGYMVDLTAPSRDGGKDIIAIRTDHGIVSKLIVECKRYTPPNKVDVGLVRQLYAVKQVERATKALLVTTSYFTRGARDLERQYLYELELKDFDAVTEWVRQHSVFASGASQRSRPLGAGLHEVAGVAPIRR